MKHIFSLSFFLLYCKRNACLIHPFKIVENNIHCMKIYLYQSS